MCVSPHFSDCLRQEAVVDLTATQQASVRSAYLLPCRKSQVTWTRKCKALMSRSITINTKNAVVRSQHKAGLLSI